MKALIASESSFIPDPNKGDKKKAMGISQLMPLTVKALQGFRNELKDHLIEMNGDEVFDPEVNIAAAIRWIFQKQKMASRKLRREATWLEAVEEYKAVLKKTKKSKVYQEKMSQFLKLTEKLNSK